MMSICQCMEAKLMSNWLIIVAYQLLIILTRVKTLLISICISSFNSLSAREVDRCKSILSEMDDILTKYQTDLDKAVNEIKTLQVSSLCIFFYS